MTTMRQAAEDYLALRRSFGYSLERQAQLLTSFAGHLDAAGATHITVKAALDWATLPADGDPIWYWQRLSAVRGLAAYLHTFDPRHQVPPADLLPRRSHRPPVYLFTTADIKALMAAAAALRPALHAATLQTLIGLLTVTGLRPGEARALHRSDIDYDTAVLTVTNSKYGKSRQVLLHSSTVSALQAYQRHRDQACPLPAAPTFFISARGTALHRRRVSEAFARLVAQAGIEGRSGRHRGPGLKDLRHAFAIATVTGWYQTGADVAAHMPALSTWMGHRDQGSTFWYLQASPQLLALAAGLMADQALRQDLS